VAALTARINAMLAERKRRLRQAPRGVVKVATRCKRRIV
jgi:hypothetical protein